MRGFVQFESDRSSACAGILGEVAQLEAALEPLAIRSQRLQQIAQAIGLEERSVAEQLDADDPIELAVRTWFAKDLELAERFVATQAPAAATERAAAREAIKTLIQGEVTAIQVEADQRIEASGDLAQRAAPCEGAILLRPVVLEACAGQDSPVCTAAASTGSTEAYRFVDSAVDLWDIQQVRPWTDPGTLGRNANGQLAGASSMGYARNGNVILTVSFAPLLQERTEVTPEDQANFDLILDSLGFTFTHPRISFVPSLSLRASLSGSLAEESAYILHFGEPEAADVLWTGLANTGAPVEGIIVPTAKQLARLAAGEPLSLTALREVAPGENEAVYTVGLPAVNQSRATSALLRYMRTQLSLDLARIVPPGGTGGTG